MRSAVRVIICLLLLAALVAGPVAPARADAAPADADVVMVEERPCPSGYTGVILDFYVGDPPQHAFTLTLCRPI